MSLTIEPGVDPSSGVRLTATLPDGRHAERAVARPENLMAFAMGLILSIPAMPPEPAPLSSAAQTPAKAPATNQAIASGGEKPALLPVWPPAAAAASTGEPVRKLELWIGAEVGGRLAQPSSVSMIDVALHGTVVIGSWLLSLAFRNTPFGLISAQGLDRDAFREVIAGVGVGRRIVASESAIDLAIEPAIVAMNMEYDFPNGSESRAADVELGLDAWVRLCLPITRGWALSFALEGDLIPGNVGTSPTRLDSAQGQPGPSFPAVEAALRIGAMGALL